MKVTILGSSSATPVFDRHPSSQILTVSDHLYLIDCGEGTIFRLNEFRIRKNKIKAIFISHLHGDHYYGLIGLLTTMSMQERKEELSIISPEGLQEIIELQCRISKTVIRFPIRYIVLKDEKADKIYEDGDIIVSSIPLVHKITTCGFLFEKKFPAHKISKDLIAKYELTSDEIKQLVTEGGLIKNSSRITIDSIQIENEQSKRYAYLSDTEFSDAHVETMSGIDLLYHESTFLEKDRERAIHTKHSTAMDAARYASLVKPNRLIIGHFSARYVDLKPLLDEAKSVFFNTELAIEGETFEI